MLQQQTHHGGLGESRGQPERRRANVLGRKVEVARGAARRRPGAQRRVRIGAVGQQRRHHRFVTTHDRGMERRKPRRRGVRVGAAFEQELDQVAEAGVSGEHRGADAPRIGVVHVRAGSDQELRRSEIADARRKHQRRLAAVRDLAVVLQASRAAARPSPGSRPRSGHEHPRRVRAAP